MLKKLVHQRSYYGIISGATLATYIVCFRQAYSYVQDLSGMLLFCSIIYYKLKRTKLKFPASHKLNHTHALRWTEGREIDAMVDNPSSILRYGCTRL